MNQKDISKCLAMDQKYMFVVVGFCSVHFGVHHCVLIFQNSVTKYRLGDHCNLTKSLALDTVGSDKKFKWTKYIICAFTHIIKLIEKSPSQKDASGAYISGRLSPGSHMPASSQYLQNYAYYLFFSWLHWELHTEMDFGKYLSSFSIQMK